MTFVAKLALTITSVVLANNVLAQSVLPNVLPQGWSQSPSKNGTQITYTNDEASILISALTQANANNLPAILRSADRPNFCSGISQIQPIPVMNSRGIKYEVRGAGTNCAFIVGNFSERDPQNFGVLVIAMEQSNSKSNALPFAQSLFEAVMKRNNGEAQASNAPPAPLANSGAGVRGQSPTPPTVSMPQKELPSKPYPLAKSAEPKGLIGMWRSDWVENQFTAFNGLQLMAKDNTLIFTSGGYFFDGVPDSVGFDDAGAQTIMRKDPGSAGRYKIAGSTIQLSYANGEKETVEAVNRNNDWTLTFRNRVMSPKLTFMYGGGLSGTYSSQRITQAGTSFVVGNNDYNFSLDGRFAKGGKVSLSSDVVSSIGKRNVKTGRYEVKASALYLYYDDGTREVYSMFQETKEENVWFNDRMYSNAR
jgi:hypothetical protein